MATDTDKAFEIDEDGLQIVDDDGGAIIWIGGGTAVPTFDAPIGSIYFRTDGSGEKYIQEGPGLNAWVDNTPVTTAVAIDTSTGAPDAGKLVKTDSGGRLDQTFIDEALEGFRVKHPSDTNLDLIFQSNTGASPNGASISKDGASGFLAWFPNSNNPQWIMGDPAAATGVNNFFLDTDMQGQIRLNTLGGAGATADVVATSGASLRPSVDLTSQLGNDTIRWGAIYGTGMRHRITQVSHTFTLPAYGVIPVYYDNVTGDWVRANANDPATAADAVVVNVIDADTFEIQEGGYLFGAHGLDVGKWHVLRDGLAGLVLPLDSHTSENVQYLFFTVDANTILLRVDPIYVREIEGPAISQVDAWTQGASPSLPPAGTNRMLQMNVNWEDDVANGISSVTIGGVAATLVVEQTITSGFSQGCHVFCLLDSEIASMVGTAVVINWTNGVPASSVTSFASFENVNQTTPVVQTNTDSGTGATDTLDADVNVEEDGYAFLVCSGGNAGMGFTNNGAGWTRQVDLAFTSADGVVDDKFITADATPENVNMGITGSNRHVICAASYRKA